MTDRQASPPTARRAALYIRSTGLYDIADSDVQALRAYVAQHGYHLVGTYRDDGAAAKAANPPDLARLLADAEQGRFDVVLVAHHTRLARTQVEAQAIIEELERHGVTVESLAGDIPLIAP